MAETGDRILLGVTREEAEMIVSCLDIEWGGLHAVAGPLQERIERSIEHYDRTHPKES